MKTLKGFRCAWIRLNPLWRGLVNRVSRNSRFPKPLWGIFQDSSRLTPGVDAARQPPGYHIVSPSG